MQGYPQHTPPPTDIASPPTHLQTLPDAHRPAQPHRRPDKQPQERQGGRGRKATHAQRSACSRPGPRSPALLSLRLLSPQDVPEPERQCGGEEAEEGERGRVPPGEVGGGDGGPRCRFGFELVVRMWWRW